MHIRHTSPLPIPLQLPRASRWVALIGAALCVASAGQAMAQTTVPASTPLYVVTYYETAPGAASAPALQNTITPAAAFTRYADSTAAEPGAVSLQVLDDSERPSRYVVLEVWQNASAFQQHRAAAATRQLGQDIAPWLNGPPDQRIHTRFE